MVKRMRLLWFVRSLAAVSVLSFALSGKAGVIAYLLFIVLPVSVMVGLLLALMAAPMVGIVRRSFAAGFCTIRTMVEGGLLAGLLVAVICCHLIGEPLVEELAHPDRAGDGMLGITYQGMVLVYGVVPTSFIGSILGGVFSLAKRKS
ncbi:hypothetical protein IXB28_07375 [Leptothoe kymatousa TAU-MAC 1615]|uniref:MotA/TolQ/ExbB proton channel domain-containing protein n=2 Tax=Leptothoe TaxID=2651725 RepID=A0ABS5Y2F8_9CYAN|nr:hypothetical protein [Leptothoe kymatousa TAU-MAC 1615]